LGRLFGPGVSPSFIGTNRVKVGCTARGRLGMVGGLTMPECRFYNLERDGQAVIARIDLKLDDDATAIAHAKQLIVGEAIEVWEGSRLVANLSGSSDARNARPLTAAAWRQALRCR
jgi:hypothetical protein